MIRLFAMDVDGTLSDGGFYQDGKGNEFKRFHVHDGYGIVALIKSGVEVAFISGRHSPATEQRARELGVTRVLNGTVNKLNDLLAIARELEIDSSEIAFIGDDIPDISCIEWAGIGMAVADAAPEVSDAADWVSTRCGGHGAVREAADHIMLINSM